MEDKGKKLTFYEPSSSSEEEDNYALPGNLGLEYKSEIKSGSSLLQTPPEKKLVQSNMPKKNRPILSCFEVRNISLHFTQNFEISSRV